jgi:hypothetical protein
VRVTGAYTFENPSPHKWAGRIGYPVYVSKAQPAPDGVFRLETGERVGRAERACGRGEDEGDRGDEAAEEKSRKRAGRDELSFRCVSPLRCAAVFHLSLDGGAKRTVRLSYEQKLEEGRAVYLLTTARRWKEPIKRAELVVRVEKGLGQATLSYPADETSINGDYRVYRIVKNGFEPDRELEVRWSAAN